MSKAAHIIVSGVAAVALLLALSKAAMAGSYYVYDCSNYGNTASAFDPWSDSEHLSTANECMQPVSGGGYRSLEIDNSPNALVPKSKFAQWIAKTPSRAVVIVGAYTPAHAVFVDCHLHRDGFTAHFFWSDGKQSVYYTNDCRPGPGFGYGTGIDRSFSPSSHFGWGVNCSLSSSCLTSSNIGTVVNVRGIRLTVQEKTGPSLTPDSSDNLWYQASHWIRGGGWPVDFTAQDPSGVCATDLIINGHGMPTDKTTDTKPKTASFTQCWSSDTVTGTLDTDSYANGRMTIGYTARNAAKIASTSTEALRVDNTPVSLVLATLNDPDPDVWINHSVHLIATASSGPSGIGGTDCSTNSHGHYRYPSAGVTVNGTGVWTVACSSWNNAFDVSGQPGRSPTEAVTIHIDETPPTIAFEPVNPSDPQAVTVVTSDAQSGVAGGQIEMRPATGGSWQSLATQFNGTQLLARFDDAALPPGKWVIQATSCDHAGNCASRQEALDLPVRLGSILSVGFEKRDSPSGGTGCSRHRKRLHRKRHTCRARLVLTDHERVGFGRRAHLSGRLTTVQGVPIGQASVSILTAPDDGLAQYGQVAVTQTNSHGAWTTTLPAGPSRLIVAAYRGSPTIQPVQGWSTLIVPAAVRVVRVWPRHIPWGGKVHIEARLLGGYLPPEGALVRLRLGYGNAKTTYGVKEHVEGTGAFEVTNTFGPGPAGLIRSYWLQECTLPEGDYPFAPSCGPRDRVVVGGRSG